MSTETFAIRSYVTNRVSSRVQPQSLPNQPHMSNTHTLVTRADASRALHGAGPVLSRCQCSLHPPSTQRKGLLGFLFC